MLIGITGEEKGRIILTKALSQRLNPLCIVDFNHKNRNLEIAFQMENDVVYDILDYLKGDCSLYQSTLEVEEGIDLIPSSFLEDKYTATDEDILSLKEELEKEYEYIIFTNENAAGLRNSFDQWIKVDSEEDSIGFSGELFTVGKKDTKEGLYLGAIHNKEKIYKDLRKMNLEEQTELNQLAARFIKKEKAKVSFLQRIFGR